MKEFPNVSCAVKHSNMNINMDSNKRVHCKQTNNEQTNKDVWAFKKRTLNHLISQNVHHINHNKGINKLSGRGLICIDFHAYCHRDLWFHQCSLISMIWPGLSIGWTTQGSHLPGRPKCLHHRPAPHPHAVDELTSWEQKTWLHTKEHVLYGLFMTTYCMVFILQLFNWDLIPYFEILPFPWWNNHNK